MFDEVNVKICFTCLIFLIFFIKFCQFDKSICILQSQAIYWLLSLDWHVIQYQLKYTCKSNALRKLILSRLQFEEHFFKSFLQFSMHIVRQQNTKIPKDSCFNTDKIHYILENAIMSLRIVLTDPVQPGSVLQTALSFTDSFIPLFIR